MLADVAAAGWIALAAVGLALAVALFVQSRRRPVQYREQARPLAVAAWLLLLLVGAARIAQPFLQETECIELGRYRVCRLTTDSDLLDQVFALPLFSIAIGLFALWLYVLVLGRLAARAQQEAGPDAS
jgi:hypothetical protein